MAFKIDEQTRSDIELFTDKELSPSVFGFYNRTSTIGGQEQLYKVFCAPFNDYSFLENRKAEIRFFHKRKESLKLNKRQADFIEYYLKLRRDPLKNNFIDATRNSIANKFQSNNDYYVIGEGIIHLSNLLRDFNKFIRKVTEESAPASIAEKFDDALNLLSSKPICEFIEHIPDDSRKLKPKQLNLLDNYFRDRKSKEVRKLLDFVYEIDVLQTLAQFLNDEGFSLPEHR